MAATYEILVTILDVEHTSRSATGVIGPYDSKAKALAAAKWLFAMNCIVGLKVVETGQRDAA